MNCCYAKLAGAVLLPNIGGFLGSTCVKKNLPWHDSLKRPTWGPPNWLFAPMWTGLYCGIGYASYLVWKQGNGFTGAAQLPLLAYGTNLALNWAWTPIFFGAHKLKLAFYEIILVDLSAAVTGYLFYKVNQTAGLLFVPYLTWLGLATALTYYIAENNDEEQSSVVIEDVKEKL